MLGDLCKLLRMCGIDTAYCNCGKEIFIIARKENRVILTKNSKFCGKQDVFSIEAGDPVQQLEAVIQVFKLAPLNNIFSRCLVCNGLLKSIEKPKIRHRVPYYTYQHHSKFFICAECQRVYWPGSHHENMLSKIARLKLYDNGKK